MNGSKLDFTLLLSTCCTGCLSAAVIIVRESEPVTSGRLVIIHSSRIKLSYAKKNDNLENHLIRAITTGI